MSDYTAAVERLNGLPVDANGMVAATPALASDLMTMVAFAFQQICLWFAPPARRWRSRHGKPVRKHARRRTKRLLSDLTMSTMWHANDCGKSHRRHTVRARLRGPPAPLPDFYTSDFPGKST
jgi:ribosomal protein L32